MAVCVYCHETMLSLHINTVNNITIKIFSSCLKGSKTVLTTNKLWSLDAFAGVVVNQAF
jgi:hypothetical protein